MSEAGAVAAPAPPPAAKAIFGPGLARAERYAGLLAGVGIERGLIGPREVPRLWDRHLLNCAALGELLPQGSRVVDVGSGAGLPGVALALARPDLQVDLVESLARRTRFLEEICAQLELTDRIRVIRGRAEDAGTVASVGSADWVTARAVAPLDRLVRWCLPLLRPGGSLLAMKGESVEEELARDAGALRAAGAGTARICQIGAASGYPTWVAVIQRSDAGGRPIRSIRANRSVRARTT